MPEGIQIPITSTYSGSGVSQATADLARLNSVTAENTKANAMNWVASQQSAKGIAAMNSQFYAQPPAVQKARSAVDTLMAGYRSLIAYSVPLVAAGVAIKKVYNFSALGAEMDYTGIKFGNLAQTINTTSDAFLGRLRNATRGTVSDFDLMRQGSDLLNLDLAKTETEAVRLSRVMAGLGMDTGQLVLALANQSTRRLDQLNISLDRFNKIKENVKNTTGLTGQELYKEAFLQSAEYGLNRMGSKTETQAGDYDRNKASIANLKNALAIQSANALQPTIIAMTESLQAGARRARIADQYSDFLAANPDQKPVGKYGRSAFTFESTSDQNFMKLATQYAEERRRSTSGAGQLQAMKDHYGGGGAGPEEAPDYGALLDGALKITSQTEKYREATASLNEQLVIENEKLDLLEKKYPNGSIKLEEQTRKVRDLKKSLGDVGVSAQTNMGGAVLQNIADPQKALDFSRAMGMVTEEAYRAESAVLMIGDAFEKGNISAAQAAQYTKGIGASLSGMSGGSITFYIDIVTRYINGGNPFATVGTGSVNKKKAHGGQLDGRGWTMVGEEGWEIVSPDGYVVPHDQAKMLMAKGLIPGTYAAGGGLVGGRTSQSGGTRGGFGTSRTTSSARGSFFGGGGGDIAGISGSDVGAIVAETSAELAPTIANIVSDAVTQSVENSPQMQAVGQSIETFKEIADTLSMILAKTPSESGIGRAVNSDLARVA